VQFKRGKSVSIRILPENLANKIAAGEVVERPASVVKELAENSLDAGASRIFIEILSGGGKLIRVSDDGCGMPHDDAILAFERHATSKISADSDLSSITTLGFRGEALPSIASVSRVRLTTASGGGAPGTLISIEGGKIIAVKETGAPAGTTIEIMDLFFNTPARLKFLKSKETEIGHIAAAIEKMALVNPDIHFRLTHEGKMLLDCPPVRSLIDRVSQVYGRDFAQGLIGIGQKSGGCSVHGFISAPGVSFSDRSRQETFVNGRPVKSPVISRAVYEACQSLLMKERHPAIILYIDIDPALVDVNVHPSKKEVRFLDNGAVHGIIRDAVTGAFKDAEARGTIGAGEVMTPWDNRVREAVESFVSASGITEPVERDRFFIPGGSSPVQERMRLPQGERADVRNAEREWRQPMLMQVADTYIIVPSAEGYMVIDQHAAHERIHYEKVKARHGKRGTASQGLLVPEKLELSAKEAAVMERLGPELAQVGIEVEHFGGGSFLIRSKPLFLDKTDIREVVLGLVSDLEIGDVKGKVEDLREKMYQLIACKAAVKAGQKLHPEAMARLVQQLFECEMPYTCAHGRPTVIKYSLSELEKMFKRK